MAGREKDEWLSIRVDAFEHERLREMAREAGLTMTDLVLSRTVYGDRLPTATPEDVRRLAGEVGALGRNVNQIARALNSAVREGASDPRVAAGAEAAGAMREATFAMAEAVGDLCAAARPPRAGDEDGEGRAPARRHRKVVADDERWWER